MKRTESLERLAHWAYWGSAWSDAPTNGMDEAQRHGEDAIRAVHLVEPALAESYLFSLAAEAKEAAGRAVRAALNAVGIRGAL